MKNKFLYGSILALFILMSCSSDDDNQMGNTTFPIPEDNNPTIINFDYEIEILSPNDSDKNIDETIPIQIKFKSNTGKIVHYIEIRIFNKVDSTEVYNEPSNNHVDQDGGIYDFTDNFVLSANNGFVTNTDWILQAKVWGINPDEEDILKSLEFHVLSN